MGSESILSLVAVLMSLYYAALCCWILSSVHRHDTKHLCAATFAVQVVTGSDHVRVVWLHPQDPQRGVAQRRAKDSWLVLNVSAGTHDSHIKISHFHSLNFKLPPRIFPNRRTESGCWLTDPSLRLAAGRRTGTSPSPSSRLQPMGSWPRGMWLKDLRSSKVQIVWSSVCTVG